MLSILFLLLLGTSFGVGAGDLRAEFSAFLSEYSEHYSSRAELKLRLALFEETKKEINNHNADTTSSWTMKVNQFAALTPQERMQYTGLANTTELLEDDAPTLALPKWGNNPTSVDHVALGHVTRPKDQRSCGSCWAFAAAAAFEGAYAKTTGYLKSFSEKELLDCVYEGQRDGCKGGSYHSAWVYIRKSGRLAALKSAPYDYARDRECVYHRVENGIKNARYTRYITVRGSDSDLEDAAAGNVVAVAMIVEQDFFSYGSGIYNGCGNNMKQVGHAVTLVGYDAHSWKVKNSWGRYWGEGGYVRFSRSKKDICKLTKYPKYPVVENAPFGETDESDPAGERRREPNTGCAFGDDYPCSDLNCNYGCQSGTCWSQCNGFCAITGSSERCAGCKEWCWINANCSKHEDCFNSRYKACNSACSV